MRVDVSNTSTAVTGPSWSPSMPNNFALGRASANASSDNAAMRNRSSSKCRRRNVRRFDACRACTKRSAGNSSTFGRWRIIRCSTTGTAASNAPAKRPGCRKSMSQDLGLTAYDQTPLPLGEDARRAGEGDVARRLVVVMERLKSKFVFGRVCGVQLYATRPSSGLRPPSPSGRR